MSFEDWCNKGTNRRRREGEAIRGCRKDIWLDWIPTAATLQRAALQTVLFYNTIQYNTTKAGSQPFLPLLLARKIIKNTIYPDTPHSCTAQLLWCFFKFHLCLLHPKASLPRIFQEVHQWAALPASGNTAHCQRPFTECIAPFSSIFGNTQKISTQELMNHSPKLDIKK